MTVRWLCVVLAGLLNGSFVQNYVLLSFVSVSTKLYIPESEKSTCHLCILVPNEFPSINYACAFAGMFVITMLPSHPCFLVHFKALWMSTSERRRFQAAFLFPRWSYSNLTFCVMWLRSDIFWAVWTQRSFKFGSVSYLVLAVIYISDSWPCDVNENRQIEIPVLFGLYRWAALVPLSYPHISWCSRDILTYMSSSVQCSVWFALYVFLCYNNM